MEGFLTTNETAARLGVSNARVRQMIIEGVIKDVQKFGRENVIPEIEVQRLESIERKPGRPFKKKTGEK